MAPSKTEQIESLLAGTACELVERYVPAERLSGDSYVDVFTVSRREILDYLSNKYNLEDVVNTESSDKDGFYAVRQDDGLLTYIQERQIRMKEVWVSSEKDAWEQFVDFVVGYSGTGLSFD